VCGDRSAALEAGRLSSAPNAHADGGG
jgi:hypothetical protein